MTELFEGTDWKLTENLIAPAIGLDMYGQKCPDCGMIFAVGFGSHKWKFCPMCGRYRERIDDDKR